MKRAIRYSGEYEIGNFVTAIRAFCALMVVLTYLIVTTTPANAQLPSAGIISTARATNWTTAGVTGGIPTGYTQVGSTIAAYNGTTQIINLALQSCSGNQFVLLGAGTFNLTSGGAISNGIVIANNGCILRGSGANSTFLIMGSGTTCSGADGGVSANICVDPASQPSNLGIFTPDYPPVPVTAGLSQGSTTLTVTVTGAYNGSTTYTAGQIASSGGNLYVCQISCSGTSPGGNIEWGIIAPNQSIIGLDQCSDGNTGTSCTSNAETDNGNYFNCDVQYASPNGCAVNGPDSGNQRLNRPQAEMFQLSAVNASTGVLTLIGSIRSPDWNASYNPEIFVISQPIQNSGVEDLSINVANSGSGQGVALAFAANCWVQGVRLLNYSNTGMEIYGGVHNTIRQNYVDGTTTAPGGDSWDYKATAESDNLWEANIGQWGEVCTGVEGSDSGSVIAYNFCINDYNQNGGLYNATFPHAGDRWELYEGNQKNGYFGENYHGPKIMNTHFREFLTGWESCANSSVCGSATFKGGGGNGTTPFRTVYGTRYENVIGSVLGTPSIAPGYQTTAAFPDNFVFSLGEGNGSIPTDTVSATSMMRWGNYDPKTGAVRFCGNSSDTGWSTTCASTSEVPTSISVYPNTVPTLGDTVAGQSPMPASFYLASKPVWFGSLVYPPIGPDVTGGNVGQCTGTFGPTTANVSGQYGGVAALTGECTGTTLATAWGGHVNANPAMNCFLNVMGGPPDGSNTSPLTFSRTACYPTSSGPVTPTVPSSILPLTLTVNVPAVVIPPPAMSPATIPAATEGVAYSQKITATGCGVLGTSACSCSLQTGSVLPKGLTLAACVISGTIPVGTYTATTTVKFSVQAQ
jgi:hypothetical protein